MDGVCRGKNKVNATRKPSPIFHTGQSQPRCCALYYFQQSFASVCDTILKSMPLIEQGLVSRVNPQIYEVGRTNTNHTHESQIIRSFHTQ
ncbi:hypothetical protein L1987_80466 [Smallanthus sonchifolius]|uniref:Uncharacterized protein n=1 Tax=Smallanthus sonchifolius TaxID=185202 RepID=A0ACB8YN53_9ASTR|nr:hypothetical protein L1987_80466 [Smallanthus sonchifolius]